MANETGEIIERELKGEFQRTCLDIVRERKAKFGEEKARELERVGNSICRCFSAFMSKDSGANRMATMATYNTLDEILRRTKERQITLAGIETVR